MSKSVSFNSWLAVAAFKIQDQSDFSFAKNMLEEEKLNKIQKHLYDVNLPLLYIHYIVYTFAMLVFLTTQRKLRSCFSTLVNKALTQFSMDIKMLTTQFYRYNVIPHCLFIVQIEETFINADFKLTDKIYYYCNMKQTEKLDKKSSKMCF